MCVLRQSSHLELAYRVEFSLTQIIISEAILDLSLDRLLFMLTKGCVEIPKVKVVRVIVEIPKVKVVQGYPKVIVVHMLIMLFNKVGNYPYRPIL
jgi:hypothetical protein